MEPFEPIKYLKEHFDHEFENEEEELEYLEFRQKMLEKYPSLQKINEYLIKEGF